jgi:hypothetical protein
MCRHNKSKKEITVMPDFVFKASGSLRLYSINGAARLAVE